MRRADPAIADATRALVRSWRARAWAAVAVVHGLALARLPLFGVLGYEHAVATTIFAAVCGLASGAALARHAAAREAPALARAVGPWRLVVALAGRAMMFAAGVTAIPAAIAALHGLWAPTCDWTFAIEAELLLP